MKRFRSPLVALAVALPAPAFAQTDDATYCIALATLANRYLVSSTAEGRGSPDLETRTAIDDCAKGNTAAGIPVLERKLRSNGFTLPKR
jgi:hypothetical protein